MSGLLAADGRLLVVAVDHPLYSWPCPGLEDRAALIEAVAVAGADAVIASYGTIRDHRSAFGSSRPILKLDLTTVALGGEYPSTEYVQAWSVEDAQRLGVGGVLTFVQLGASFELEALRTAGRVAAEADRAGLQYVCEIMPVESARFPKDDALKSTHPGDLLPLAKTDVYLDFVDRVRLDPRQNRRQRHTLRDDVDDDRGNGGEQRHCWSNHQKRGAKIASSRCSWPIPVTN